ncbi:MULTISPECIES: MFS transporter [Pseudomonas]|jgi:MFS family permease|uniref:Predicted arabinose efflux permease, MFS family n=2 Tax=Pseudomonas TaxID=286 RepID=A0A231FYC3_PSEJE|nr:MULTISPECIES: MFS transporter [Pseudomonas]OXR29363.1 MFS transporter [Pseudomonas jessenii]QHF39787.1 MFS transporter [Pseudomonas sp. S34]SEC51893.1 Predicted arabinose efflux permease, MFS family [Pseudomonas jessenii]VVN25818.1 Proline/betaine transporter [Pseudomonas fluorescens]VVP40018.1 Proline/betaine transporter [Pseudomonas fluorescens]
MSTPVSTAMPDTAATRQPIGAKAIAAITIGSGLEFYDFSVYSFFATLIGRQFFPVESTLGQLLLSLATFGVGFGMRPIGGLVLGAYADRVGRKPAMMLTLWLMALGSLLFTIAPTYAQIGVFAPLIIVLARLIQGFAIGGEVGASTAMLMEHADDRSRGFYGSWQLFSQGLSFLLGALVALALSSSLPPEALESWGWRVPFALGMLVIPVGIYIRRHLKETAAEQGHEAFSSVRVIFTGYRRLIVTGVLLVIGSTASSYIVLDYMTNYTVTVLHLPMTMGTTAACLGALVQISLSIWAGRLSDRIGRRRTIALGSIPMLLLIYPAFMLMNQFPTLGMLLAVSLVTTLLLVLITVPTLVLVTELFPRAIRATGLSIIYCLGVSVFGGFAQFFATGLIGLTGNNNAPALYVMACLCLTLIGLAMVKETAGKPLD